MFLKKDKFQHPEAPGGELELRDEYSTKNETEEQIWKRICDLLDDFHENRQIHHKDWEDAENLSGLLEGIKVGYIDLIKRPELNFLKGQPFEVRAYVLTALIMGIRIGNALGRENK